MKFRYSKPAPIGFQLAPMLDVVFLLLIFFVVTQTISLTEQDFTVRVPTAENAENKDKSRAINEIIINIRENGTVIINRESFTLEQLYPKLERLVRIEKNQPVRIRFDANTKGQEIVNVLDVCRKAGIWNISFSTRKPGDPTSPSDLVPHQS